MSPVLTPEILQQMFGQQTPEPTMATTPLEPVSFAEDNLIDQRNSELRALDPQNVVANLDFFDKQKRSGKKGERTKMDKLGTGLSYLTEALAAFTGGAKYQNPWQRAEARAVNDYKLKAPRIIDELRILNQNKRQYQADQTRTNIAEKKIEAEKTIATMQDLVKRYQIDNTALTNENKLAFEALYKDADQKYGKDPLVKLRLLAAKTDFEKLKNDPNKAAELLRNIGTDKRDDFLAKALSQRISGQQRVVQTPTSRTGLNPYDGSPITLPGMSSTKITAPLNQEEQQRANQLFGPLMPTPGQPQQATPTTPAPTESTLPEQMGLVKPEILPDPKNNQQTLAQRVFSNPSTASPGNIAPVKQKAVTQSVALSDQTPTDYDNDWKTVDGKNISAYRTSFGSVNELQNRVFNIQNENGAVKTPWGVIDDKTFARRGGDKEKKNFIENQRAVMDTNGIVSLGLRQYIRTGGDLLTGLTKNLATEIDQYADKSLIGRGAKILSRVTAGRKIDDNDRALAFLTTKTYFDAVYAKTGMQANQFEFQNAKKYQLHTGLGSDAFMFRALVLALAANRKMDRTYEELSTKKTQTNPPIDLDWAVERASVIMKHLQEVKSKSPAERERILQNTNLDALLNPRAKVKQ